MSRSANTPDVGGCAGCLLSLGVALGAVVVGAILWVVVATVPLYYVWNWIVPDVFPGLVQSHAVLGQITIFQAIGLTLLSGILFGVSLAGALTQLIFKAWGALSD